MGRRPRTIGLLHHIGGGNLGDDATQSAVMLNIRRRWPHVTLIGFSANPDDTRKRHGIRAYAIRRRPWTLGARIGQTELTVKDNIKSVLSKNRLLFGLIRAIYSVVIKAPLELSAELLFLARAFRLLRSVDLLIINGGGQLTEWGGPWSFPYTLFKWTLLARLAKVSCVFLTVGAGPLTRPLSKFFVRRALSSSSYASFRDQPSCALARRIGFSGQSPVFPDSAYGLELPALDGSGARRAPGKPIVGLAPMPYCDPRVSHEKDQSVYISFIRKLGVFASWLVRNDYRVALFGSDIGIDPLAIEDLRGALRADPELVQGTLSVTHEPAISTEQLLDQMSSMDYVVTCRLHGVIFAHLLNKPVVAIAHHPKVATLMSDIGLAGYCLDIRTFDPDLLIATFTTAVRDSKEIRERMAERLVCYRRQFMQQFDDLFPQVALFPQIA
jgi:polysaccharide pyruvyl transferase WcaK-like protein